MKIIRRYRHDYTDMSTRSSTLCNEAIVNVYLFAIAMGLFSFLNLVKAVDGTK
ncbi:hypothetical protein BsWGS_25872 [Bradybaena similaris]